ncbi:MAG: hypothetical protein JSS32_09900 [Verrucomicrobia bacterium]|nr:hypothetical protein [Verrucomicrobiota bacterium]
MKLRAVLSALVLSACSGLEPQYDPKIADQLIDYPIQNDRYAIIVVEEGGISSSQARKMAMQRAAELTVESGNRYFTIESDQKIQVAKSGRPWPDQDANGNTYQEIIIQQNFGKDGPEKDMPQTGETMVPALRLIIQCYSAKPSQKSYDACKWTDCP